MTATHAPARTAVLELTGVSKTFGAVQALKDIDFDVHAGEVVALVGDNGAGKSTLIKGLAGVQPYDSGSVRFDGQEVVLHTPRQAAALGIEVVYQDLALSDNLDIVQNMFLGREETKWGTFDEGLMEKEASDTLRSLSVRTVKSVRQKVSSLSGGQRQTVAIARAVLKKARVVILDEPTAALGLRESRRVLDLIRRLRDSGHGVIVVSHAMDHVMEIADRAAVMRRGRKVGEVAPQPDNRQEIVSLIVGG